MKTLLSLSSLWLLIALPAYSQPILSPPPESWAIEVNSLRDGAITADTELTLREAIVLSNGTLTWDQLSELEQAQVSQLPQGSAAQITFNLPSVQTENIVYLTEELPPLAQKNLILDGAIGDETISLAPAENKSISRGLVILADGVTVQNMQFYGFQTLPNPFNSQGSNVRPNTLTADILITHGRNLYDLNELDWMAQITPPQGVTIANNRFGMPDASQPEKTSSFGVMIYEGIDTQIKENQFYGLRGSAILTGAEASGTQIIHNEINHVGGAGMPDAIRLEGTIAGTEIHHNTICHSAGSGIFLFKPSGAITIRDNNLHYNGQQSDRAAIYLMGSGHQVFNNHITHQSGGGVVVAAYPRSTQNRIQSNRFAHLGGLSIDLVARRGVGVRDYTLGDGVNPPRDSPNRRVDTANQGIDAPQFLGEDLFLWNDEVTIAGEADPGAIVDLYQVAALPETIGADLRSYAPLADLLASVPVDETTGTFQVRLKGLKPGDRLSAIATDPRFGTSEPARNAIVRQVDSIAPRLAPAMENLDLPCQ